MKFLCSDNIWLYGTECMKCTLRDCESSSIVQIMASTVVKAVIGSKVKSLTEDVEGRCAKPLPEMV